MTARRSARFSDDDGRLDLETARQFIASSADENPAVRALMGQLTHERDTIARLLRTVLADPDRLAALYDTGLLDGASRMALDQFAELTAEALGISYAAVSMIDRDRQVLVGCSEGAGMSDRSRPLELSICKYAVASGQPLVIDDTATHPLLVDNPLVFSGAIRAYAGIPLRDDHDNTVGTLCAWDDRPRRWTGGQIQILADLAAAARLQVFAA